MAQIAKNRFLSYQHEILKKNIELEKMNEELESKVLKRTKELEETQKRLEIMATTDELTGLFNRYYFNEVMDSEIKRAKRYHSKFSLIILDVDFFKHINDNFGHHIGDEVLKEVSNILTEMLRDVDSICRIGGEEFAVILPATDLEGCFDISERLRIQVEKTIFIHKRRLTISLGIGAYSIEETVTEFIKRCDDALYKSKKDGRNKTTIAQITT